MKSMAFALLAALTAATPALGEDWGYSEDPFDDSANIYIAYQQDLFNTLELDVECFPNDSYGIVILTGDQWDQTASYADPVPVIFTIDGADYDEVPFHFVPNDTGEVLVVAPENEAPDAMHALINAFAAARDPIALRYFTTNAVFQPGGSAATIAQVSEHCH